MHRPPMDWAAAARRDDPATLEGRVFALDAAARPGPARRCPRCRGGGESELLGRRRPAVLAWRRRHPRSGNFVGLANFAEHPVSVDIRAFEGLGAGDRAVGDGDLLLRDGRAQLPGLGFVWLAEA